MCLHVTMCGSVDVASPADVCMCACCSELTLSENRLTGPVLDTVTAMTQLTYVRAVDCVWVVSGAVGRGDTGAGVYGVCGG